jgi:hypothetical protein
MLVGNGMSKIANAMVIEFHVRGINQDMYKLIWYKILKLKKKLYNFRFELCDY